ncbi:phage baseplate assembly protein V [[Clostridium] polysaccharolyticum]|uniref:Gp5/Type VI secretion system Vgr protein OB-fold domain-containing protein n=1 Tax=[Clostridium] polysaccharolyticum TaxID=29364 RepID=A0A1I0C9N0_9FIRM|nr:phage baseplate assembly protein V [[Clostridium] polysaccharolyticum]SET16223.1 hypothetical protein SAMN04487772_10985 [[Clostridium] polysaccharolyticum]
MSIFGELFEEDGNIANKMWGVTTGIVLQNWDEKQPGKVKVEMNLGTEGKNVSGWIPVMTPYGGKEYGLYTLPEVGALVIVAFLMGDRNRPVVIGSLWNQKNSLPADTAKEKNAVKRFKTKGGCEVIFQEEESKEKITVHTPGELTLLLDDEKKTISIQDKSGENGILINSDKGELSVQAKSKIELKVNGTAMITLDGNSKKTAIKSDMVDVNASQSLKFKSQSVNLQGSMVKVKADSSLGLESGAMAQLKGSMVKIN